MSFIDVTYAEPHKLRNQQILAQHPEVKKLFGPEPRTLIVTVLIMASQIGLAWFLSDKAWWLILLVAYVFGAFANHALFVIIHEATHNLILKSSMANKMAGIFANLPIGFPMAMSFRKYHLIHHKYQGDPEQDADLATEWEVKWVGNSPLRKAVWLFFFAVVEILRPMGLKKINLWDRWTVANLLCQVVFDVVLVLAFGFPALVYLTLSSLFSVGLHPVGARWIQEHYIIKGHQETYSYYGLLNYTALNVGHHNEHHDFMFIPWSRLPVLRKMAPGFYDSLHFHTSWTKLLFKFLFDRNLNLDSRVIRRSRTSAEVTHETRPAEVSI